jgi:hypothetical protein
MSPREERFRLPKELQYAAAAAAALVLSFVLPWYQKTEVISGKLSQVNVSALGAFTFVEGAILLVAAAVGFLVWQRARRKGFHLPGGDGVAITLAGAWCTLLIVFRMFDQPDDAGIQWGLFGAFVAAGALIATGARIRQVDRPEPPNPAADDAGWVHVPRRERERPPDRKPRDATAVTEFLRDRPAWEGEAPTTRLDESPTTRLPDPSEAPTRREARDRSTERLWDEEPPR